MKVRCIDKYCRGNLMENNNIEYIAIFDSYGGSLPDSCPEDLESPDFESRKALAVWLLENCKEYITETHDDITVLEYSTSKRHWLRGMVPTRMAVVPVYVSRPWLLHRYDGKERIWYLDQVGGHNQVKPDVQPKLVAHGFTGDSCVIT